jgi:hypothetical protein
MGLEPGWQHDREGGKQGAPVVPAHPLTELDPGRPEEGRRFHGLEYVAGGEFGGGGDELHHDALEGLGTEGHPYQLPNLNGNTVGDAVSKGAGVTYR